MSRCLPRPCDVGFTGWAWASVVLQSHYLTQLSAVCPSASGLPHSVQGSRDQTESHSWVCRTLSQVRSVFTFPDRIRVLGLLAVTEHHRWGGSNNRNVLSHSSGGWKSGIKVQSGLAPPESMRDHLPQASPHLLGGFLAILGVPWLVDSSPWSLPPSSHGVSLCVSVSVFLL